MLSSRLKIVNQVINKFKGTDGEPDNDTEIYILKSMWVMLMSEFEGSVRDIVESYIDKIKKGKEINKIHICLLLQNFYGNREKEELTIEKILNLYNKKKSEINYSNFTKNKKAKYKYDSVKKLFNSLGIFFKSKEDNRLRLLDGIASTRDSIAHGDHGISITSKQLKDDMKIIQGIYRMLKNKLLT